MGQACCALEKRDRRMDTLAVASDVESLPSIQRIPPDPLPSATPSMTDLARTQFAHVRFQGRLQKRRNRLIKPRKPKTDPIARIPAAIQQALPLDEARTNRTKRQTRTDPLGIEPRGWQHRQEYSYDGAAASPQTELLAPTPRRPLSLYLPSGSSGGGIRFLEAKAAKGSKGTRPLQSSRALQGAKSKGKYVPDASQSSSIYYTATSSVCERTPAPTEMDMSESGMLDAVMAAGNVTLGSGLFRLPSRLSQDSSDTVVRGRPPRLNGSISSASRSDPGPEMPERSP